jgi:ubiquinone/menaquinone biosynthesis C-methylase UbiE
VVCALGLCHVANLATAIAECSRVLKRGGHLLITDFHPQAIVNGWETTIFRGEDAYILPRSAIRALRIFGPSR